MSYSPKQGPINLTESASRMPWSQVEQVLRVRAPADGLALEIRGLSQGEKGFPNAGLADTVYVIVSGYGLLRCGEAPMDCTEGDVLFVPSGCAHEFERLDGEIRIWRISLVPASRE